MRTKFVTAWEPGLIGWATIQKDANLPRWLPAGAAVRILRIDVLNAYVEEITTGNRGTVRRHKIVIPPLYFLDGERRWVSEGDPAVLAHYRYAIDREMFRPCPDTRKIEQFRWVITRWRALEGAQAA